MRNVKSFLAKNFLILALAVGGVFIVTTNLRVSANETVETEIGDNTTKRCLRTGGGLSGYARTCIDSPGTFLIISVETDA
jgi:hypothetical protein